MHESFKAVLEKEREAEKIVHEAKEKAEKLVENAKEKAERLYKKIYQENIDQAKIKSEKMKEKAKNEAEIEAQIFFEQANELKENIQLRAKKNFDDAVNFTIKKILS